MATTYRYLILLSYLLVTSAITGKKQRQPSVKGNEDKEEAWFRGAPAR
jgi:hypothetical protein